MLNQQSLSATHGLFRVAGCLFLGSLKPDCYARYIDESGKLVIPCQWKKVEFFKNGKARVLLKTHFFRKDEWVYIDKQGRVL